MDTEQLIEMMTKNHQAVVERFETTQKALAENQKALAGTIANVADLQQKLARGRMSGGGPEIEPTWGQQIVESPEFKAFKDGGARNQVRLEVKAVTIGSGATQAGGMIAPMIVTEPNMLPRRRLRIRDLLAPGQTISNSVWYTQQTARTNAASTVSESGPKPQSGMTFQQKQNPVVTIATYVQAARQALDDAPALQSVIDNELRYFLGLTEETELLTADGTNGHLTGLIPQSTAYAAPYTFGAGETGIDRLALATLQAEQQNLPASGFILNPLDWRKMKLLKNTLGEYILGDPSTVGPPTLWGLPVVTTNAMFAGQFLAGSFGMAAQIFDRMAVEILISTEHNVNFTTNEISIRAEERLAMVVKEPLALILGSLP
jgi:HK97 family phage major capsid protein